MRRGATALSLFILFVACSSDDEPESAPATTVPACEPIDAATATHERVDLAGGPRDGWYLRYVPATPADGPRPVVVDLHGYSEGAEVHVQMSDLAALADTEGFVVVSPQGTGDIAFWNHLQHADGPPDVEFLAAVLDDVEAALCTDPQRVYATGLSNGGFMTSTLACELADRIAAVAPVAGVRFEEGCAPARAMPVIAFHGTADELVTFDASPAARVAELPFDDTTAANFAGYVPQAVPDAMAAWAEVGGCDPSPTEEPLADDVTLVRWGGCDDGVDVELVRIEGGGHAWPGSELSAAVEQIVGHTTMSISANELLWEFFEAHSLGSRQG